MIKRILGLLASGLCLSSLVAAQTADIGKDARLQKPISIKLKIVPIGEALAQLTKLCGVALERSSAIKDLKVTVLVQDVPAGLVLDKIGKALDCEWKADGPLFRLSMTTDEQSIRDRYLDAEDKAAQKEIADELDIITQIDSINPGTLLQEIQDQEAAKDGAKDAKVKYDPKRLDLLNRARNRQDAFLGRFLLTMSPDKVNAFWRGDVIAATQRQLDNVPPNFGRTGRSAIPPTPRAGNFAPGTRPDSLPLFVQYDPLVYRVQVLQGFGVRFVAKNTGKIITAPLPVGALAKLPFGKRVLDWDQPVPTDGDLAKLEVKSSKASSKYFNHLFSVADFLEKAFDQTQVPIVADAFRIPAESENFDQGVGPLTSWLAKLKEDNHLTTRIEDGVLMVRHGGFWRLRKFEVPEEQIQALEAKVSKTGPTLQDYCAFVDKLSPEQAKPFCLKKQVLSKFDILPIQLGLPALKFFAGLDSGAIERAMADGISYGQLSNSQRQSFVNAAIEGVFFGATPGAFDQTLLRLANTGDARGMGFVVRKDQFKIDGIDKEGQDLLFGANLDQSTLYKLPVDQ